MTIEDLPAALRPREKLLASGGAGALGDAELPALLLRTGVKGTGVPQLAEHLLAEFGGITGLLNASGGELGRVKGMGRPKRVEPAAVHELARSSIAGQLQQRALFDAPGRVKDYLGMHLAQRTHEVFAVLFLDAQNQLLKMEEMFRGTLTQTSLYPREVVKRALALVDIRVLDHLVVRHGDVVSFAERGLL